MKNFRTFLWGIVLVVIGVILGTNALNITNINIFFNGWWTLFIIVPSFIDLFKEENKTGNLIMLTLGIILLLACQDFLEFDLVLKLFIPLVLVITGLSLLFKNTVSNKITKEIKKINKTNPQSKEYYATFSGQKLDFAGEEFSGCKLSAIFGGIDCDLTEAIITKDTVITASSIFGGINLYAPSDVNVKVNSSSIFGGVTNKKKNNNDKGQKTIYINATCLFGGIEIK